MSRALFPAGGGDNVISSILSGGLDNAVSAGIEAGKNIPTSATNLANGITVGIEGYDKQTKFNTDQTEAGQRIDHNALVNSKMATDQANEAVLAPQAQQVAAEQLQKQRDDYAQQIADKKKQDQLQAIMSGDDQAAKAAAVTSGEYSDTFAKDPNLYKAVLPVSLQAMTPAQRSAFQEDAYNKAHTEELLKHADKINEDYDTASSKLLVNNAEMSQMMARAPEYKNNQLKLIDNIEMQPQGTFTPDKGDPTIAAYDPTTGQITRKDVPAAREDGLPVLYQAIDKTTHKIVGDNLSKEFYDQVNNYSSLKNQVGKVTGTLGSSVLDITKRVVAKMGGNNPTATQPTQTTTAQPDTTSDPAPQNTSTKTTLTGPALVTSEGKVAVKNNPEIPSQIGDNLKLDPATKAVSTPELNTLTKQIHDDIQRTITPKTYTRKTDETQAAQDYASAVAKTGAVKGILTKEYLENEPKLSAKYSKDDLKQYNDLVDVFIDPNSASWRREDAYNKLKAMGISDAELTSNAETPLDLYIKKNIGVYLSRLDAIQSGLTDTAKAQLQATAGTAQHTQAAINALK